MKRLKSITNASRNTKIPSYRKNVTRQKPHKALTKGKKNHSGHASSGRISMRQRGGGHKKRLRDIDFKYDKKDIPAKIESVEYDPNRTSYISLVCFQDGERRYVLTPGSLGVGDIFVVSETARSKPGNRLPLFNVPVGTFIYNVEIQSGGGAKLVRSAGTHAEVIAHEGGKTHLRMPSGEVRKVDEKAWGSIGEISGSEHKLRNTGKAGRSRWQGKRPKVRGSVMNPVDHPHGGGEGRQPIGLRRGPKTRTGRLAYGVKTRRSKKYSDSLIVSKRRQGKKKR